VMSGPWMSIIEYARTYNVSDMTVRRRIKTGRLNAELRDGKYFIPIEGSGHSQREEEFSIDLSNVETEMSAPQYERTIHQESSIRVLSSHQHRELELDRISETFEMALDQIKGREELLKANFASERARLESELGHLESALKQKDKEMDFLRTEIEDLEVLVRILETKTV